MKVKPGMRLRSQVDATEVIVVRTPADGVMPSCGGRPMIDAKDQPEPGLAPAADAGGGTQLGKRYTTGGDGPLELLVIKGGEHALAADGVALVVKEAKPLPASD